MADPGVQGDAIAAPEVKQEVNLEDPFADMESDEEFTSSNQAGVKLSSSPKAPSPPAYVV